jgi:2-polyprenyl-3-methyl-5-hydroxy-6-metoxy-1,4-benzoquinol methylase
LGVLHDLGWEVHGTDMLPPTELMGLDTQRYYGIEFRPSNIEVDDLPYEDETFDVVVMSEIIEHFHFQPLTAMRRAFRLVKPGGFMFVTTPALGYGWTEEQYTQPFEQIAEFAPGADPINPHLHMKIYSPEEFSRLLHACGGRDVLCDVSTSPHKPEAHCVGFIWK